MKQANNRQLFLLDRAKTYQDPIPFFMQPIIGAGDGLIFGFEILFRGGTPPEWSSIDKSVIAHLCESPAGSLPTFFVNICAKAFLEIPNQSFIDASINNKVYFELSESLADDPAFDAIIDKMDMLSANGVLFAFDNFGRSGQQVPRIFAQDQISAVKVDGSYLAAAMADKAWEESLAALLAQWRNANILSIAEWVENAAMLEFAARMQFDLVQGFHIDAMMNGLDSKDLDAA